MTNQPQDRNKQPRAEETEMSDEIYEVSSTTPNLHTELARQLEALVPEAIADGKVDIAKLKELLGDDVQDESERFGLFWPGKKRALRAAQAPTTATLRPDRDNSKDWDTTQNIFIEGDNLEVLKILQKFYHRKIKMIYIDPPYNTGNDFVYPDNYQEGLDSYLEWTKQVNEDGKALSTNAETDGRYHSNWLNMMYPRLKLARNLLSDDGAIFISIDDNEIDNLIKIGKEIFGENNLLNVFVWISNLKGRQISGRGAASTKEYLVAFARNSDSADEFRASASGLKALMPTTYKGFDYEIFTDDRGPFVIKNELHNTNSAFNEVTRPNLVFDIYFNPETKEVRTEALSDDHAHKDFIKIPPRKNNNGTHKFHAWRWSQKKVQEEHFDLLFKEDRGVWKAYTKVRDVDSTSVKDLMMDITTSEGSADIDSLGLDSKWFDYPKPVNLIKLLVEFATNKDSIVLDFFAGSATTAHAVVAKNLEDGGSRKFIQVQLPEPLKKSSAACRAGMNTISDVSKRRILAVLEWASRAEITLLDGQVARDLGVRSYSLADTNFEKWQVPSTTELDRLEQTLLNLRDPTSSAAAADSILTELLLKQGFSLSEHIELFTLDRLDFYSIGEGALVAYLDGLVRPSLDQLRAVLEIGPAKFLILEDAFQGDDELKTNLKQICKSKNIELWTA
jgi:adenine-specific DNA-methyltransferase